MIRGSLASQTPIPDWERALGPVLFSAVIRSTPADFEVTEELSFDLSGDGEHDFLWVEKTSANTQWVALCLAQHAGVPLRDVGFSGLKDRHAITRQWFSVRRPGRDGTDWQTFVTAGVRILEHRVHRRKLKRGTHRRNVFRIVLRGHDIASRREAIVGRLARIRSDGVPNYFGEQRFGRDGGNMDLAGALFSGRRLTRSRRSIAMSAARSFLFNEILATRVSQGTWNTILPGELANLDESGSVFAVDEVSDELVARCLALDIHPSATMWGDKAPLGTKIAATLERDVTGRHEDLVDGLLRARVTAASRALRLPVRDLRWEFQVDALRLEFSLYRGGFATAVLRELARTQSAVQA